MVTIILSPFQKYKLYGVFPTKFILHVLLLLFATMFIVELNLENTNYKLPTYNTFLAQFLDDGTDFD